MSAEMKTIGVSIDPTAAKKGSKEVVNAIRNIATSAQRDMGATAKSMAGAAKGATSYTAAAQRMARGLRSTNQLQRQAAAAAVKAGQAIAKGAGALVRYVRQARNADGASGKLAGSFKTVALAAAGIVAGVVGINKLTQAAEFAIVKNANFEQSMADLSAITGLTGAALAKVGEDALRMGDDTQFSGSQAAEAFKLVASAKSELASRPKELANVTDQVLLLAQAAKLNLATSATFTTASLNQFKLGADQAGRVVNVLAASSKIGASEVAETGEALKQAGAVASSMGISFESATAAVQTLARANIKGGEAGTALRAIMLRLETQTNQGLRPSVVGLSGALENLSNMNLDATQAKKLFGEEAIAAGQILIDNRKIFDEYTAGITDTKVASEQAAIQTNTLMADYGGLQSAVEGLGTRVGQQLNPALRTLTQNLTSVIKSVSSSGVQIEQFGTATTSIFFGAARASLALVSAGAEAYKIWVTLKSAIYSAFNAVVSGVGGAQLGMAEFGLTGLKTFKQLADSAAKWASGLIESVRPFAPLVSGTFATALDAADQMISGFNNGLQDAVEKNTEVVENMRAEIALTAAVTKNQAEKNAKSFAAALNVQNTVAKISTAITEAQAAATKESVTSIGASTDATEANTAATEKSTQVKQRLTVQGQKLTPVVEQLTKAHFSEKKALDAVAAAEKAKADQAKLDDSLKKEITNLKGLVTGYGKSEEALIRVAKAQMLASGHSLDLVKQWERLKLEALDLADASHAAADSQALMADVAQASLGVIADAGIDLWRGQIDDFGDFRDVVLDGLSEIAAQMVAISAIQWALPSGLGGVGGAFGGFGQTDLGMLLSGGKGLAGLAGGGGGGLGNIGGSLMSNHGGINLATYAGPALAGVAVTGTLLTAINSISDGGLFGTSWDELARTVELSVTDGVLSGFERVERERERSLFRGTQTEVIQTDLPTEMIAGIQQAYDYINATLVSSSTALGLDVGRTLAESLGDAFSVGVIGGEDYFGAVTRHLVRMGERLVREVAPGIEVAADAGENLVDAYARVAQASNILSPTLTALGTTLDHLITPDFVAQTIQNVSNARINELAAGAVAAAEGGPFGLAFEVPADGVVTDEMRAQLEAQAAALAEALNLSAEQIAATMLEGQAAIDAARLVYVDRFTEIVGGNAALTEQLSSWAGHWMVTTESVTKALEQAVADQRQRAADAATELETTIGNYEADFAAARAGGLSPEDLAAWFELGNIISDMYAEERALAQARGEALQYMSLTRDMQAAVDQQVANLNETLASMQLQGGLTGQALLNLNTIYRDSAEIANRLAQVHAEMVPESIRNEAAMTALRDTMAQLDIDMSQSTEAIRAQFLQLYTAAITAGDADLVQQLDAIFGALDRHLDSQEAQTAALAEQAQRAAEDAQRAAEEFATFNESVVRLGIGLAYTGDQADLVLDTFGSIDNALRQWQLTIQELYSDTERAEMTMSSAGATLAAAGVDLARLGTDGRDYFRSLVEQAIRLGDTARASELANLTDEMRDYLNASDELTEIQRAATAATAEWATSIEAARGRIAGMITAVSDNGLNPASQLDQVGRSIAQITQQLTNADSAAEQLRLNEELAALTAQRYELERQAIIDNAELAVQRENERRRQINEATQEAYRQQMELWRTFQRNAQGAASWNFNNAATGAAPVVQLDVLRAQFEEIAAAVAAGQTPSGNLTQAADRYLATSQQVYGASGGYAADLENIRARMAEIAALAQETAEPVEPPELPLLNGINENGEAMRIATERIGTLQESTITRLREIDDNVADLLEQEAERAEQRQAEESRWRETMQAAAAATEDHSNNVLVHHQQTWPVVQSILTDMRRIMMTASEYTGRIYQTMTADNMRDEFLAVQRQQIRATQNNTAMVERVGDRTVNATYAVLSAIQALNLSPIIVIEDRTTDEETDPDVEAQEATEKRTRQRFAYA